MTESIMNVPYLPSPKEAERAVLGSLMEMPSLLAEVTAVLNHSDFYEGIHREVFETICRLADAGAPVSRAAVTADLDGRCYLDRIGGPAYLITLVAEADSVHALYFAQVVREQSIRRRLREYHIEGLSRLLSGSMPDLERLMDAAHHDLTEVADEAGGGLKSVGDGWLEEIDRLEEREAGTAKPEPIIPTGLTDLDRILDGGFRPGQMITIAARPGYGKSTLGLDIARNAVFKHSKRALLFTLEMSHDEIVQRLISAETRIPLNTLRVGVLTENHWNAISHRTAVAIDAPLLIDDTGSVTVSSVRAKAQLLQKRQGLDLVIIDYLQLMSSDGHAESRQQEVSRMSRACKILAKDLGIPVIVISQLNRGPEQRADKRPQVSDLRESGAIEQDSDVILLIHREDEADPTSARVGEADIIVGKHRNGPTGVATVVFQGRYSRFADMATG